MNVPKIAVVGSGIIGLSTAVAIAEGIPVVEVTVISEKWTPETTGDRAPGLCRLYLMGKTNSVEAQVIWATQTFEFLERLYATSFSSEIGISLISGYHVDSEDLSDTYEIIINCPGVYARQLLNDKVVYPIRGQVLQASAPWVKSFIMNDNHYIIPNSENVVLGGPHQEENWSRAVDANDRENILQACYQFIPSLKHAKVITEWVGLRPGRKSVRIEREQIKRGSKTIQVGHYANIMKMRNPVYCSSVANNLL